MTTLTAIRFAQAEDTAAAASPADAARAAWARTDAIVREAPGRATWACRAGCAACCHLLVRVGPGEADAIVSHVQRTMPPELVELVLHRLRRVAQEAAGLGAGDYRLRRIRCAFLDAEDRCSIYAARPVFCRVHASRSAAACQDLECRPPLDTWLGKVGTAIHAGLGDLDREELHDAVARRLPP